MEAARAEEVRCIKSWRMWEVRPVAECRARVGKNPIGSRWVGHHKGDVAIPSARSCYVAKDVA
eukprot:15463133-Alexandrium_andersonii.AAC.1